MKEIRLSDLKSDSEGQGSHHDKSGSDQNTIETVDADLSHIDNSLGKQIMNFK